MGRVDVDLTAVGVIPDGEYVATVTKLSYQVKVGENWNREGTQDVDYSTWMTFAKDKRRLHFMLMVPGKGSAWHDLYMMDSAAGFAKEFMVAARVSFDKSGFEPEEAIGKQLLLGVTIKDDGVHGPRNEFRFKKA